MTQATKFTFDREFSKAGEVIGDLNRYRTQFTRTELEAAQEEGFLAGENSARIEEERRRTSVLQSLEQSLGALLPTLDAQSQALKKDAANLAYAGARAVAGEALRRFPEENLIALFAEMAATLRNEPALQISLPADDVETLTPLLHNAARAAGIASPLSIHASAAGTGLRLQWRGGALSESRETAIDEMRQAISNWLHLNDIQDEQLDLFDDLFSANHDHEGAPK
jgi:flagellar assembly protein FliH